MRIEADHVMFPLGINGDNFITSSQLNDIAKYSVSMTNYKCNWQSMIFQTEVAENHIECAIKCHFIVGNCDFFASSSGSVANGHTHACFCLPV